MTSAVLRSDATVNANANDGEVARAVLPEPLRMTRLNAEFARMVGAIPQSSLTVPSMMSVPEKRFLFGLASRYYTGVGIIVDAGIFLGASTRCFGEGVRKNSRYEEIKKIRPQPIISFEKAIVNPGMPAFFQRNNMQFSATPGESFEAEVRGNIAPVKDLVELRIGDILQTSDCKDPIEILFLDILKLPEISLHAFQTFFAQLIPGRSIVIQQDYFYERLPYIKTHQEALNDYFEFIGEIGSTAVFRCTKRIPEVALKALATPMPVAEQLRLASIAMQRSTDPSRRFLMALSKMRLIRKLQGRFAASEYLDFVKGEFPEQISTSRYSRLVEALRAAETISGQVSIND